MATILGQKVDGVSRAILIALSKVATEKVLSPIVGNANLFSGIVKTGVGLFLASRRGLGAVRYLGYGMVVDGVEDIVYAFLKGKAQIPSQSEGIVI